MQFVQLASPFQTWGGWVATPPPLERGSPNKDGLNVDLLGVSSICSVAWEDVYTLIVVVAMATLCLFSLSSRREKCTYAFYHTALH